VRVRRVEAIPDDCAGGRDRRTSDEHLAGCVVVSELESSLEGDQNAMFGLVVDGKPLEKRIKVLDG
jgi:hypothetical protein